MNAEHTAAIHAHLAFVYGEEQADLLTPRLAERLAAFAIAHPKLGEALPANERVTQDDVILITYGDQVHAEGEPTLRTLATLLNEVFGGVMSGVHILPFYPYTSDDGFSVVDYTAIDPALGDWPDLAPLRARYRLMYDAVVNHISASSQWFQAFLAGQPGAEARFITLDPSTDVSQVTRPRTHPLLTRFETPLGERWVWTTFSTDQIDINFGNPDVLLDMIDVLLLYVAEGASLIRLDAIGYMWKELGTRCIHLPETHRLVQLFRSVMDAVAPNVLLVTETNVPHADNISYFGDGTNEAQMVYQFPLAPLVLNALHTGRSQYLTKWAKTLQPPTDQTTFFNFLASHDGIGVVPATGILSVEEVGALAQKVLDHGGQVSFKSNSDGSQSPYELNITLFDALSNPNDPNDRYAVARFICANAIMLALQGVPGVYVHSLVGSHNNYTGLAETGRARTINREKWEFGEIKGRLETSASHEQQVFAQMSRLVRIRRGQPAFHPGGPQAILNGDDALFSLLRTAPDGSNRILCIHNVSDESHDLALNVELSGMNGEPLTDLISGILYKPSDDGLLQLTMAPYQVLWLAE